MAKTVLNLGELDILFKYNQRKCKLKNSYTFFLIFLTTAR